MLIAEFYSIGYLWLQADHGKSLRQSRMGRVGTMESLSARSVSAFTSSPRRGPFLRSHGTTKRERPNKVDDFCSTLIIASTSDGAARVRCETRGDRLAHHEPPAEYSLYGCAIYIASPTQRIHVGCRQRHRDARIRPKRSRDHRIFWIEIVNAFMCRPVISF